MSLLFKAISAAIVLVLAVSCQNTPESPNKSIEITDTVSENLMKTSEPQIKVTEQKGSSIVSFYESNGGSEDKPTYLLFIKPRETQYEAMVLTECDGADGYVVAGTNGIMINNHCILETVKATAYAILPDGTTITVGPETRLQINLEENSSELILEKGEIVNNVAPQGNDRSFAVMAGDTAIIVAGTQFGVSLKDKLLYTAVIDGTVFVHRCINWLGWTCGGFQQLSSTVEAGQRLSAEIGGEGWDGPETVDFYNGNVEDFPLLSDELLTGFSSFGVSINGEHFDEMNHSDSLSFITAKIEFELINIGQDVNFYNQLIGEQYKLLDYCIAYSGNCPVAELIPTATAESQQPESIGGGCAGPSGKFPPMDQGSCFNNSGALFCFPVSGSVDPTYSAEWNITEICRAYSCETFCSWLP